MKAQKLGCIFQPTGEFDWSKTHAQVPFAMQVEDRIRIYFSTRDSKSRSCTSFVEIDAEKPQSVLYVHNKPCISKGKPGYFDDSGAMPSWFIKVGDEIWLYYTAWNVSESASYRLSIGLAKSYDGGITFQKSFEGPILERDFIDPIWVGQPCVMIEDGVWKMWYLSCQKIKYIDNHPEPFYNVKYATSKDGIVWKKQEITCIDFSEFTHAIGRPCIYKENGIYKMFFSHRHSDGYRNSPDKSYRIGFAESSDGIKWKIQEEKMNFIRENLEEWESDMQEYCSTWEYKGERYIAYNGNGFGKSGFGIIKL